jgi:protein SCO1/2
MPEMTMAFTVKDTNELDGISPGDEITFTLKVDESGHWIEDIRFVAHHISEVTSNVFVFHVRTAELKPGDPMPDGELTAEDGGKIHFSDFRGRALAFTFFFTRCPLPDYCPRMSKNFADARKLLLSAPDGPANWQFLCISFDPGFDTPEMLSSYGNYFREGSTDRWLFAAASTNTLAGLSPQLDLMVLRDGANITHNLRTVVLDTNGKIFRQFDSNEWTPQELADAIRDAAKIPTP